MVDGNQKPLVQLGYMLTEVASLHLLEVAVGKAEELGIKATVAVVDPSGRLWLLNWPEKKRSPLPAWAWIP